MATHKKMPPISRCHPWQRLLLPLGLSSLTAAGPLAAQPPARLGPAPTAPPHVAKAQTAVVTKDSSTSTGLSVDISTRLQSLAFYQAIYQSSENVPSGWTGNLASDVPGTTSQAFRDAIALRINYFRAMAGVPATITLSDAYNAEDQQAALMMSANGQLNHHPPASWIDYTAAGAEAAGNSNLYLGINGPTAITGYVEDPGDNNAAAGHRRWILYPQTTTMGSGDVDGSSFGLPGDAANALWVLDGNYYAPRPATRDSFVAWPPPGYVPYTLVFPRWSFSYPDADFTQASVGLTESGKTLAVTLATVTDSSGENTLVWTPQGVALSADNPRSGVPVEQQEPSFHVTVSNVLVNGAATSFSYDVTAFDPAQAGTGQPPAFFAGQASVGSGVEYLTFPNGNVFGYYTFLPDTHYLFHFDMGYEYVFDAQDGMGGVYLYDFESGGFFYTSPSFSFPYLYDFGLKSTVYYFPDPARPGRYDTNGVRYFYVFATGKIITK